MQNCALLEINKKKPIQITWKGNEECFKKNKKKLELALGNGSLSWKRENQKATFPLQIRYKTKLVAFNESLICRDAQACSNEYAFLHFFFLYPISLDDYRYNCRPIVSEWFARLNEADYSHWIIVFDSSQSKEKKVRANILEKIRNDFAKHLNKLVEINDFTSVVDKTPFFSLVQSNLIGAFNSSLNGLTGAIQKYKDSKEDEAFSPSKLVNLQYKLCQFYWNLSLFENALHELDDLDQFLTNYIFCYSSFLSQPNQLPQNFQQNSWLKRSKLVPFGVDCTYLSVEMHHHFVEDECGLVRLRGFILAHQILLTFYMFFQRYAVFIGSESVSLLFGDNLVESSGILKGASNKNLLEDLIKDENDDTFEPTTEMAHQIHHNFISFILRYTHDALLRITEDLIAMRANYSSNFLHILIVVWHSEVFYYCQHLDNILEVEAASFFVCQMSYFKCDALIKLLPFFSNPSHYLNEFTIVRRWFEASDAEQNSTVLRKLLSTFFCIENTPVNGENESIVNGNCLQNSLFEKFVCDNLSDAIHVFENFGWHQHVAHFNMKLIELLGESDRKRVYQCLAYILRKYLSGELKSFEFILKYSKHLMDKYSVFLKDDFELCFDCYLVLCLSLLKETDIYILKTKFANFIHAANATIFRSNLTWNLPINFPWKLRSIVGKSMCRELNQEVCFKIVVNSDFKFLINNKVVESIEEKPEFDVCIKAVFKPLSLDVLDSFDPTFVCQNTKSDDNLIGHLSCFLLGKLFLKKQIAEEDISKDVCQYVNQNEFVNKSVENDKIVESQFITLNAVAKKQLSDKLFEIEFAGQVNQTGCFALDHFSILMCRSLVFHLDYQKEKSGVHSLKNLLLFVDIKKPTVRIVDMPKAPNTFFAGVVQSLCFELNVGTIATTTESVLKVSFVFAKPLMEFWVKNEWKKEAEFHVPSLATMENLKQEVIIFLKIDGMNFSADELLFHYELCVNWLDRTWFFPLTFTPIMHFKSATSLLNDSVLFEVDVQRCDRIYFLDILPTKASFFQDQNIDKEPTEALLLNSYPFAPIVANSSYKFVWQLPALKIGKTISVNHFIEISYSVQTNPLLNDVQNDKLRVENILLKNLGYFMPLSHIVNRSYGFQNNLTFTVPKKKQQIFQVEYEVCAHVLSDRPQSVLCRIDLQCDLIVSLRALTSGCAESIIVVIEVDTNFWLAVDRFKVVHIKGSGLGQTNFTIIPKQVGFLPYPSIFVHQYMNSDQNDRKSFNNTTFIGERLISFHRYQGKQIHVLGQRTNSDESSSWGSSTTVTSTSTKKSFKSQAKLKIQKLFDLKD